MSFDPEAGAAVLYVPRIRFGKIAPGKTKIIDGIQQVGLAHAVVTANSYDALPELEGFLAVILELYERYIP